MITAVNFYANNFAKISKINVSQKTLDFTRQMNAGKSYEDVVKMVLNSAPRNQFIALASMYCLSVERTQQPADLDPADGIIARLGESLAKYGEKTHPLSEAQIRLVVGKVLRF